MVVIYTAWYDYTSSFWSFNVDLQIRNSCSVVSFLVLQPSKSSTMAVYRTNCHHLLQQQSFLPVLYYFNLNEKIIFFVLFDNDLIILCTKHHWLHPHFAFPINGLECSVGTLLIWSYCRENNIIVLISPNSTYLKDRILLSLMTVSLERHN